MIRERRREGFLAGIVVVLKVHGDHVSGRGRLCSGWILGSRIWGDEIWESCEFIPGLVRDYIQALIKYPVSSCDVASFHAQWRVPR